MSTIARVGGSTARLPVVYVRDFSPFADGSGSDTTAIQAAITAAAALVSSFTTKSPVTVVFDPKHYRASGLTLPGNVALDLNGARLTANASGPLLTISGQFNQVRDGYLNGGGLGVGANAIVLAALSHWNTLENLVFDQFAGRAVYDQGLANWSSKLFAQNCLLDAGSLATYTGVYEVVGTDSWITNCEFTASRYPANGMSASGKACALAIYGANTMATQIIAETSDHGVYLGAGATQLRLSGVRGELNYGHGWLIEGGSGRISDPMALRNSKAGDLLYDGFRVSAGGTVRYTITNAWSECDTSSPKHNNGICDLNVSVSIYNQWINPVDINANVGFFGANSTGTTFAFADHPPLVLTGGTATPSVSGKKFFTANNGSAVTVTNFLRGVNGQQLLIKGDGFTTLAHNATISNTSGANLLLAANTWYRYLRINGVWTQLP